ncbi:MAG: YjfB family protein [Azoarcus sp.]|jgi:hypothetical protein|nr:YjfB family protein [Azoarcus sp.]
MDISSTSVNAQAGQANTQVAISVLKKAIDIEAASALQLIQAIPTPQPATGSTGAVVNTWA